VFILNPHSGVPIYRQLCEQIRRMVASGQLEPGVELPSIRDLALKHAINPMTVSKAYAMLESEGVLVRHRGKPMTVASGGRTASSANRRVAQLVPLLDQLVVAATQLDLAAADVVDALHKQWEKVNDRTVRSRKRAQ
jgi:DNA-binding transcriptional regulator YhcF (GntR family)